MEHRTTVVADSEDLAVVAAEARRQGVPLGRLLGTLVAERAAVIRRGRQPRVGIFRVDTSIAEAMRQEDPARRPFR